MENSMFNEFNESDRITSIRTIFTYNHVEFITYIVFENNTITYDLDIINANKIGNNIVGITEFYNRFKSIDTILISSYIQRYFENRKD
ncbi:hypothetical protein [Flavobacterium sp.]|uniref:hypothetical protein n=1 Tax=Flavobacterium sp. TaxID=239 RepID=UPI0025C42CFA|nr:hypothetical protein [Flavobacterium sp.]